MFIGGVLSIILVSTINTGLALVRVKRQHSRIIHAEIGDTVRLEWMLSCDPADMVFGSCGYRNNGRFSPSRT